MLPMAGLDARVGGFGPKAGGGITLQHLLASDYKTLQGCIRVQPAFGFMLATSKPSTVAGAGGAVAVVCWARRTCPRKTAARSSRGWRTGVAVSLLCMQVGRGGLDSVSVLNLRNARRVLIFLTGQAISGDFTANPASRKQ